MGFITHRYCACIVEVIVFGMLPFKLPSLQTLILSALPFNMRHKRRNWLESYSEKVDQVPALIILGPKPLPKQTVEYLAV
jgi:hypothetical protein